jgi:UDP-N-acetylmuramate dehydrogenase
MAGLKGYAIGGAQISSLHGNFIVNRANGSSQDVLNLLFFIRRIVHKKYGILLQPEIHYLSPWGLQFAKMEDNFSDDLREF